MLNKLSYYNFITISLHFQAICWLKWRRKLVLQSDRCLIWVFSPTEVIGKMCCWVTFMNTRAEKSQSKVWDSSLRIFYSGSINFICACFTLSMSDVADARPALLSKISWSRELFLVNIKFINDILIFIGPL